jgi:hypothetical protein
MQCQNEFIQGKFKTFSQLNQELALVIRKVVEREGKVVEIPFNQFAPPAQAPL